MTDNIRKHFALCRLLGLCLLIFLCSGFSSQTNLWKAYRKRCKLPINAHRTEINTHVKWFLNHQRYLQRVTEQAQPYFYFVYQEVLKRNMPVEIALLPVVESAYNPYAYSHVGAAGLWQIMPGTGTGFGLKQNWWYDGRRDIYSSTRAALDYLSYLHDYFDNNWLLAIAAYDSGEGTVSQAIKHNLKLHRPIDFWSLHLPKETLAYVPRLLALSHVIRYADRYHIHLPYIPAKPYFTQIDVGQQIELHQAARYAGIHIKELYQLNPGYNHWATDPKGPHMIVLPLEKVAQFKQHLVKHKANHKSVAWQRHIVKSGDTLGGIAHHYRASLHAVKAANKLDDDIIQINQALVIPKDEKVMPPKDTFLKARYKATHYKMGTYQQVRHIVKPHDSYLKIARRYHVRPGAIRFWNHLGSHDPLKIGKELIIWKKNKHGRKNYHVEYYRVKNGDNLSTIAYHRRVKSKDLKRWNPSLAHRKYLKIGQILKIRRRA